MSTDNLTQGAAPPVVDLYRTDEKYEFRLTGILRKRRHPLLLMIDERGRMLCSSLPDDACTEDLRLRDHVLTRTRSAANGDFRASGLDRHTTAKKGGERRTLFMLDDAFYSLTLFPMHGGTGEGSLDHHAVLVEPMGLLADGIDYPKVKETFRLSNREVDVLQALMSGDKDKDIARVLGVTAGTIRAYLRSIRAKLRVTTRTAIVNRVHEMSGRVSGSS